MLPGRDPDSPLPSCFGTGEVMAPHIFVEVTLAMLVLSLVAVTFLT
jgi:hypothetical protein